MRKQGECIIGKRLKFRKGFQKKFILEIKKNSGASWEELALLAGVSSHTLRIAWLEENATLPHNVAVALLRKCPFERLETIKSKWVEKILPARWGQKLGGKKAGGSNRKGINLPVRSEELAELFGIILGDGHLGKKELTITSALHERKHMEYAKESIRKLFGADSKVFNSYTNENVVILDCYSSELVKFLGHEGLSIGNKIKNRAALPKWVSTRNEFAFGALRGLFDTDGGIYCKQKGYSRALIEFQTASPCVRNDVMALLKKTGFAPSKSFTRSGFTKKASYNVRLQQQPEVHKFFRLIGSSNPKNIVRYKHFAEKGRIPRKEDLYNEIMNYNGELPFKAAIV